jgi:hypothetical protein
MLWRRQPKLCCPFQCSQAGAFPRNALLLVSWRAVSFSSAVSFPSKRNSAEKSELNPKGVSVMADNDNVPKVDRRGTTVLVPLGMAAVFVVLAVLMMLRTEETAPTPPPPPGTSQSK